MESNIKLKNKKITKDRNTQFCELYKSFSNKKLIKYKIEMIIGMYLKQKEKELNKKIVIIEELNEKLKIKNKSLTEEIEELKNLLENCKNKNKITNIDKKLLSSGLTILEERNKENNKFFIKYRYNSTSSDYIPTNKICFNVEPISKPMIFSQNSKKNKEEKSFILNYMLKGNKKEPKDKKQKQKQDDIKLRKKRKRKMVMRMMKIWMKRTEKMMKIIKQVKKINQRKIKVKEKRRKKKKKNLRI